MQVWNRGKDGDGDGGKDHSEVLRLLHQAVLHTGTEMREAVAKGIEKLDDSGRVRDVATMEAVTVELSRMRNDLRDTKNRMVASLSEEVRQAVVVLRSEVRSVTSALDDLTEASTAPTASAPDGTDDLVGSGSDPTRLDDPFGTDPCPQGEPTAPEALHGDVDSRAAESSAVSVLAEAAQVQDPVAVSIPAQRDRGDDADRGGRMPAEQVQEAVRLALADVLPGLLESAATPADASASDLVDVVGAVQEEVRTQIGALLGELRGSLGTLAGELRGSLDEVREQWQADLAGIRQETAALTAALRDLQEDPTPEVEITKEHSELLRQAARVSSAVLLCHRDTWGFVTAHASRHPHFRVPPQVADNGHERVGANVSGRSLIALLISLFSVASLSQEGDGDHELASTIYQRISESLLSLDSDGQPVTIVLDDRTPSPAEAAGGAEESSASGVHAGPLGNEGNADSRSEAEGGPGSQLAS